VSVTVHRVNEFFIGDWIVVLDDGLRDRVCALRAEKLPNETGGVLLGSFDLRRKILYMVDTLPSPPDSDERSDLYIRGFKGLRAAVEDVDARTGGMLEYIGEWHSHPRGSGTRPSGFDLEAFGWLTTLMSGDGLPAVMMIVGDHEISLFVGSMGDEVSPIPEGEHDEVA
jgi:integrative and conjugative element protein (TIGR02256 family)